VGFILGIVFLRMQVANVDARDPGFALIGAGIVALAYVSIGFTIAFINAAAVAIAVQRLRGGEPSLLDALASAAACVVPILGLAILGATIGLVLRLLTGSGQRLLGRLIGISWSVVTFLAVPVIVVERAGPVEALRRSAALLHAAWGEQVVGRAGFGLPFFTLA